MAALDRMASMDDLRRCARRRMPRFAFDFIDGGAEDERNLRGNQTAFHDIELLPRYLVDVSKPSTGLTLWNHSYAAPIGIAPVGFLNMAWPGADMMAARLAAEKRIPYVVGSASSTPLEDLAEAADGMAWFQIYIANDATLTDHLLDRAKAVGCDVLVVTVDVSQPGKRDRDIRNGLQIPFRLTPRIAWDLARNPAWSLQTLRAGPPGFANCSQIDGATAGSTSLQEVQRNLISNTLDWDDLRRLRDRWTGPLVVKGLMHPEDARLAVETGCDAIQVSNHGGRQADYAPPAIAALPGVVAAVGKKAKVFVDGGVRRGGDAIRAKALGADLAFTGRPFAYGAAAGGYAGMRKTYEILSLELTRALGQIGRPNFEDVDETVLARPLNR